MKNKCMFFCLALFLSMQMLNAGECLRCHGRILGKADFCSRCKYTPEVKEYLKKVKQRDALKKEIKRRQAAEKEFTLASIKYPRVYKNPYFSFDKEFREWTSRRKGVVIKGKWSIISEDNTTIYLRRSDNDEYRKVSVSALCDKDRKYVEERIALYKGKKYLWWDGGYFSASRIEYIKKAEDLVLKRSYLKRLKYRIFQVLDYGALALFCKDDSNEAKYNGNVFFLAEKVKGLVSDTQELWSRLFWASTYEYINKANNRRTVDRYTLNFETAVAIVRAKMNWYDKDDPEDNMIRSLSESRKPSDKETGIRPPSDSHGAELKCLSSGSGFFVTDDGYLVTNEHVVDGGRMFKVVTSNGCLPARLVKVDKTTDLALLKIDRSSKGCLFSKNRIEKLGSGIFTFGFPRPGIQGFEPKVTKGIISGLEGFKGNVHEYQIDASIQPGNSGGPLFDEDGCVVGVIVASLTRGQLVNYAIKKTYLTAFLDCIPECSRGVKEGGGNDGNDLETVIEKVRDSCGLVLSYR